MSTIEMKDGDRTVQISRLRRGLPALAGPALMAGSTLLVLRDYVFRGLLNTSDALTLWLPTYCFLGRNLAHAHIPAWNPHVMAGVPFAADPQSGWMNVPAMALFAALPCGVAIQAYLLLQPLLGGLGLYWFLRGEGLGRPAATVGGLTLALGIAGSELATALPFSASLAWTAVLLATASRFIRARSWSTRLLWALAAAIAWGQIAAALLTEGLAIGTGALLAYAASTIVRSAHRRAALGRWAMLVMLLVPVNLAYLLPRLEYLPRTTLGLGYARLDALNAALGGQSTISSSSFGGGSPAWPLNLALSPGLHLGAVALVLALGAWLPRRHRPLAAGFGSYGLLFYLASLNETAGRIGAHVGGTLVDTYLHAPGRLGLALVLAVAVLGAVGLQGLLDAGTWRERGIQVLLGLGLWGTALAVLGAPAVHLSLILLGAVLGAITLALACRRPGLAAAVPAAVAVELVLNGWAVLPLPSEPGRVPVGFDPRPPNTRALPEPLASIDRYLGGGRIGGALPAAGEGRYVLVGRGAVQERDQHLGIGSLNEAMVLGVENGTGYNSVQLQRYWTFIRGAQGARIIYNRAYFLDLTSVAADLLQVRSIVSSKRNAAPSGSHPIRRQDGWVLVEAADQPSRGSVVTSWTVVDTPEQALATVLLPGFEPGRLVVLERDPGIPATATRSPRSPPAADYEQRGPISASVRVDTAVPAILLVRNSFDPHWHAEIDGRGTPVLVADSLLQGVAVPRGRHTVELTYDDPWIGYGLMGSSLAVGALLAAAAGAARKRRKNEEAPGVGLEPTTIGLTGRRSAG